MNNKNKSVKEIEIEMAKIEKAIKESADGLGLDHLSRYDRERILEDSKTISGLEIEYTSKLAELRDLSPSYKIRMHFCPKCKEITKFKKCHYIGYISQGGFGEMASSIPVIRKGLRCAACNEIMEENEANKRGLEPEKDEE